MLDDVKDWLMDKWNTLLYGKVDHYQLIGDPKLYDKLLGIRSNLLESNELDYPLSIHTADNVAYNLWLEAQCNDVVNAFVMLDIGL